MAVWFITWIKLSFIRIENYYKVYIIDIYVERRACVRLIKI